MKTRNHFVKLLLELFAIKITSTVCLQILHGIPRPAYVVHRQGQWLTIPPRSDVDFEVIPFTLAFKSKPNSPDVFFITTGCVFLLISVVRLIIRSRILGSTFLIPLAVLCSNVLSFVFALRIAMALDMPIHPTPLTHSLPFLIAIIGFDEPLLIAHAVFHSRTPCILFYCPCHAPHATSPTTRIIKASLASVYPSIFRDPFLKISVLALAAYLLPIGDRRQLCTLTALSLVVHCLLFSSYFIFALANLLRARIRALPNAVNTVIDNATSPPALPPTPSYFSFPFLGKKGTSLYNISIVYTAETSHLEVNTSPPDFKDQIPKKPHLKLLILTAFLLFNLITPFNPFTSSHHSLNQSNTISNTIHTIPDVSSPHISAMLTALVHPDASKDVYVKLYPHPSSSPSSVFSSHISTNPIRATFSITIISDTISITLSRSFPFLSFSYRKGVPISDHITLFFSIVIILGLFVLLLLSLLRRETEKVLTKDNIDQEKVAKE